MQHFAHLYPMSLLLTFIYSFEVEVNISPPLLIKPDRNFNVYTQSDLNICRGKLFKANFIDISKHQFTPTILFCLEVNNTQLLRDSELIRLLETTRSLNEYILKLNSYNLYKCINATIFLHSSRSFWLFLYLPTKTLKHFQKNRSRKCRFRPEIFSNNFKSFPDGLGGSWINSRLLRQYMTPLSRRYLCRRPQVNFVCTELERDDLL